MYSTLFTQLFAFGTLALQLVFLGFLILLMTPKWHNKFKTKIINFVKKNLLAVYMAIVLIGVAGSLIYSEVVGLVPCGLCWWQRLFLYPQALMVGYALYKNRKPDEFLGYGFILSLVGGAIALFHYVSQLSGVVREIGTRVLGACGLSALEPSCYDVSFIALGYITIPMMALTIFVGLIILYYFYNSESSISWFKKIKQSLFRKV